MDNPRELLRRYGLSPRKALGQNFLVSPSTPTRIVEQAALTADDTVLEVGAGLGTLTVELAARSQRVIAVETDPHLMRVLQQELVPYPNVTLVHGDILELDPATLLDVTPPPAMLLWGVRLEHYHVVANLPYYITAAVTRHLLEAPVRPAQMVITVQREVAQRMTAAPNKMSMLAVSIQFYGKPKLCLRLKRGVFFPPPRVESAVVRLDLYAEPPFPVDNVPRFFQVARAGFAQRRKQLRNTLAASLHLRPADVADVLTSVNVASTRRAETLELAEWGVVVEALGPLLDA